MQNVWRIIGGPEPLSLKIIDPAGTVQPGVISIDIDTTVGDIVRARIVVAAHLDLGAEMTKDTRDVLIQEEKPDATA